MDTTQIFVGIDISKAHLDTATRPARQMAAHQRPGRHRRPGRPTRALAPSLVVLEATGGLELPLLAALQVAGIPAAAINPARPATSPRPPAAGQDRPHRRRGPGHFAEAVRPNRDPAFGRGAGPGLAACPAASSRWRCSHGVQPPGSCADPTVRAGLERHLAWLKAEVADADRTLAEAVKASPAWRERDSCCGASPGWVRSRA